MKTSLKLALALFIALPSGGLGAAGEAQAHDGYQTEYWNGRDDHRDDHRDGRGDEGRGLSSLDIHGLVSYFYYDVAVQDRRGDTYFVSAETPRGQAVRLRVNAYSGEIENVDYLNGGSQRRRPELNGRRSSAY
jgi:hypothetical protein